MSIPTTNDPPDPILEELHATRRQLLAQHGGVHGLAKFLRDEEAKGRSTSIAETQRESMSTSQLNSNAGNPVK